MIDWENGGLADPSQELGIVLFEYGLDDPDRIAGIYDAYVHGGGTGRIEHAGDFSMLIAQLGHVCELACARWLEAGASGTERVGAAQRFDELTSRPVTRAGIDHMLHAVMG